MDQKIGWFGSLRGWLAGKKTYLAAGLMLLLAGAGAGTGKLTFAQSSALVSMAAASVGLGAKMERHQAQIVQELQNVARVTADVATHRYAALGADLVATSQPIVAAYLESRPAAAEAKA